MAIYDLTDREVQLIASALSNRASSAVVDSVACKSKARGDEFLSLCRETIKDFDRLESRFSALAGRS